MTTETNNNPPEADAAEAPLSLAEFRVRLDGLNRPTEAWVRVAVVDAVGSADPDDMTYELTDHVLERRAETLGASLTVSTVRWLSDRYGADGPWRSLIGHDVGVRLRATPTVDAVSIELVDIAAGWLERWWINTHRERMALLAGMGVVSDQRGRQIRHAIESVDVLRDDDVPWTVVGGTLHALVARGVSCRDVLRLGTSTGTSAVSKYLERLATGGIPRPDAVLIVVLDEERPAAFLNDIEVALFAAAVQVPIILGAPRPRGGSLLHEVVFGACDDAATAAALLEEVVEDGLRAQAHARRVKAFLRSADNPAAIGVDDAGQIVPHRVRRRSRRRG